MHIIIVENRHGKLLFIGDRQSAIDILKGRILGIRTLNANYLDNDLSYIELKKLQYEFYNDCVDVILSNINKDVGDCNLFSLDLEYGSISCQHVNIQKRVIK